MNIERGGLKVMKIAVVYTSTTPQLIETIEQEIHSQLADRPIQLVSYQDPTILSDIIAAGAVPPPAAARLVRLYLDAAGDGCQIILSACSSIGDVAAAAQPLLALMGVPLVRIDQLMAQQAVLASERIAVLATLPTTMDPTVRLVRQSAAETGRPVVIHEALADGAFGLDPTSFRSLLLKTCAPLLNQVDLILMAQGSMAYSETWLHEQTGLPVYSSPRFGASALRELISEGAFRGGVLV
jgi:Asp/Glu/hydantoin racemase